jgi:hypothetical protein
MKVERQKQPQEQITRRDAIRIGSAVAFCASLIPSSALASEDNDRNANAQTSPPKSVFEDTCRTGNGNKYQHYDSASIYPVIAFWLMLTTDEWGDCLAKADWRARLATELKMPPQHLEFLYGQSLMKAGAFADVKKIWQDFVQTPPPPPPTPPYGARPCPGGKTLLQIAGEG